MTEPSKPRYALVLSGGGARGAYEAGVVHYIRTRLPREIAHAPLFHIYAGTSVGAINSAFLASTAADPIFQGARLRKLWRELRAQDIYRADVKALTGFLVKTGFFAATNFFGLNQVLEKHTGPGTAVFPFRSVLDTTPFMFYLRRNVAWAAIHRNIERGVIDAVTISATHMLSGHLALFVEKNPLLPYRPGGVPPTLTAISPKHVLASAALPLVFPIIRINRQFYGDGSLRQNTPMSPAIHLGASRLLVVAGSKPPQARPSPGAHLAQYEQEPTLGDILGRMLNNLFEDKLTYDLEQMRRINALIEDAEQICGTDALKLVNERRRRQAPTAADYADIQKVETLVITPSEDIGVLASHHFRQLARHRETLNPVHRFFAGVVESSPDGSNDFLSYLLFEPQYLESLLELGFEDARKAHDRLVAFFAERPAA